MVVAIEEYKNVKEGPRFVIHDGRLRELATQCGVPSSEICLSYLAQFGEDGAVERVDD